MGICSQGGVLWRLNKKVGRFLAAVILVLVQQLGGYEEVSEVFDKVFILTPPNARIDRSRPSNMSL